MISYQRSSLEKELAELALVNPLLHAIVLLAGAYTMHRFRKGLILTSIYRNGDTGVHGYWRGADADNDELAPSQKKEIEDYMNSIFQYDPARPHMKVCYLHAVVKEEDKIRYAALGINPGGDHFHMQTHVNTTSRRT